MCEDWTEEELNSKGYYTAGIFKVDEGDPTIELYTDDPGTLRHEQCHYEQYISNRLHSCKIPFFRYIDEAEAYFSQYTSWDC